MEAVIQHFLKQEKKQLEEGNSIQIIALEHQFKKTVEIAELNKKIHFKGTVDRIDRYNGTLRFVDYKTGKVTPTDCAFSDWEELIIDPKKSPLFQVMMYVYLLREEFNNEPITGGVIPLKNFDTNFLAVSLKEHLRKKNSLILEEVSVRQFELVLFKLLGELYDPAIPLEERPV
jgi:ATP-dependent helicase/nuclease subunit B